MKPQNSENKRKARLEMSADAFKKAGYAMVDQITHLLQTLHDRPVTKGEPPKTIRKFLGEKSLPLEGSSAEELLQQATQLLVEHSLFNSHPRFWGYITAPAAPIGILGDFLASAINPNIGANILSPMAVEMEKQTIQWIAQAIGYPAGCGGVMVSGGNMANFTGFLAGRTAQTGPGIREKGLLADGQKRLVYCSKATHTWIEKAANVFGFGTEAIRWINTDTSHRMDVQMLEATIQADQQAGHWPMLVAATAGDVSTGAVDPLSAIADVCAKYHLWFHIDGAYGAPAAMLPALADQFRGIEQADSIALDPHKWLYCPLEAGLTLVKNPQHLLDTFSSHPNYYNFEDAADDPVTNFYEYGLQNSRGFRALKVWLTLQHAGLEGYRQMIEDDIALARYLFERVNNHPELEGCTHNLSITTFRYVPKQEKQNKQHSEEYLNDFNKELLNRLQVGGEVFLSNAVVNEKYYLRACIVNFRTTTHDLDTLIEVVTRLGRQMASVLVPE